VESVTLVDAENVRRSEWPNIEKEELVDLIRAWADATGTYVLVVFDGEAPDAAPSPKVKVVGTTGESADDRIARDAEHLARDRRPYRLVTSDRGLRARAGAAAFDLVGGGTFARTLRALTTGPE
jgi:predicted RNA-binding protein with PIN domain